MHRTRNLLLALVLVAALALAAWLVLRPAAEEPAPEEESSTLYSVDSGAITGLSWVWEGGAVALRREDGVWLCPLRPETAIDQSAAAALAAQAASVAKTKDLAGADPVEFGFDQPRLRLRIQLGETEVLLELGLRNDYVGGDYARLNGGDICLTDTALYDAFAVGMKDLVPQDDMGGLTASNVQELSLTAPGAQRTLYRLDAEKSPSDFFTWYVASDGGEDAPADSSAVSPALSRLAELRLTDCVDWQPESLAPYGLDEPVLRLRVQFRAADAGGVETEQTRVLLFGSAIEPAALIGQDVGELDSLEDEAPQRQVYAMLDGSELVYAVDAAVLDSLQQLLTANLSPTAVCPADWSTLRVLRLTIDGVTTRLGIDKAENGGETTYSVDGRAADYDTVYETYRAIRDMAAQVPAEQVQPEGEPVLTAEFHRDSDRNTVVTVRFYSYDGSFYLAETDGAWQLLVSRRDVQSLTERVQALRDGGDAQP